MVNPVHTADTFVMVPPEQFKFNSETSIDNEFQQSVDLSEADIKKQVKLEFQSMVNSLVEHKVNVILLDQSKAGCLSPDAVFPNNWFGTFPDGSLYIYAMAAENRRTEANQDLLIERLMEFDLDIKNVQSVGDIAARKFLEGTGVLIFDHINQSVYAALSNRCDPDMLMQFAELRNLNHVCAFRTQLPSGGEVYHTNVMMSIGENVAVICDQAIVQQDRNKVLDRLVQTKSDVISISIEQMKNFCGNILQIQSVDGKKYFAMSTTAYKSFTELQIKTLQKHAEILHFDISTIEKIGGGSVRCMLAEIFLPSKQQSILSGECHG